MLKTLTPRKYQIEIFKNALDKNTMVVLPTGLGKTAISMMVSAARILKYPSSKIIFVAPTKPLVEQQMNSFKKQFLYSDTFFELFTGSTSPEKRKELYQKTKFIFSTPQTIENDLISKNIDLSDVSLLVFDEAHRATGNYSYVYLAQKYMETAKNPLILAMTASPGTDDESIKTVCKNIFIENIEFKSKKDDSVKEYVKPTEVVWQEIILTTNIKKIISFLNESLNQRLKKIKSFGFLAKQNLSSKIELLNLQRALHSEVAKGNKTLELLQTISLLAECIKLNHALELTESQSIHALNIYLEGIITKSKISKTKSIKNLISDLNFISALALSRDMIQKKEMHPKIIFLKEELTKIFDNKKDSKIIIFTQFRDTAEELKNNLINICNAKIFFGQAKRNGISFSQKQQKQLLEQFTNGEFQVLIATSVAEEGLDIPSVDKVFFYEPIPSAIRSVQRRGRTGRHTKGMVCVLVSKGTKDEIYRWSSYKKEQNMDKILKNMSQNEMISQPTLKDFTNIEEKNKLTIYVDHREKGSGLVRELLKQNVDLKLKQLEVGDFILSSSVAVEFKNVKDFVDSIVDGRLLMQLPSLLQYEKPLILIEGDEDIYAIRNVNASAIDGMFATIATSYRIPLFRTKNEIESARILIAIAKREQLEKNNQFTFHSAKPLDNEFILEYVVSSFPNIGGTLAKKILSHYDTLKDFFNTNKSKLLEIEGLGDKKAEDILNLLNLSFKKVKK